MSQYFYEDQVYSVDKNGSVKFGLVVENEVILNPFCLFFCYSISARFDFHFILIDVPLTPLTFTFSAFPFKIPSDGEYENHSESDKLRKGELRVGFSTP